MKQFNYALTLLMILFFMCMGLVIFGCGDDTVILNSQDKPVQNILFQLDSFTINARDTGIVNNSNYREWITQPDSNIHIEFDGMITSDTGNTSKYIEVSFMHNNALNFYYQRYDENINGHHSFSITDPFDMVIFYIKIYNNYSLPAFIRLSNITITKF